MTTPPAVSPASLDVRAVLHLRQILARELQRVERDMALALAQKRTREWDRLVGKRDGLLVATTAINSAQHSGN